MVECNIQKLMNRWMIYCNKGCVPRINTEVPSPTYADVRIQIDETRSTDGNRECKIKTLHVYEVECSHFLEI